MHGLLDGFSALSGKIPNAIPGLKSPSRADLWAAITASCLTDSSGARFAGLTNPGSSAEDHVNAGPSPRVRGKLFLAPLFSCSRFRKARHAQSLASVDPHFR